MGEFEALFDKVVAFKEKKYLTFYDKDGILSGGVWVVFEESDKCILQVLPDRRYGDVLLCVKINSLEETLEDEPLNPENIIGFALGTNKRPKSLRKFLISHWSEIKTDLPRIKGENKRVYSHILEKLNRCQLMIQKGYSMQQDGLVEPWDID